MWQSKSEKIRKYYFRYWVNVNAHIMSCIIYDVINTGGKSLGSEWIWLLWITYIKQFVPSILIFYAFSIKWVWKYHCRISSSWTKYFFFLYLSTIKITFSLEHISSHQICDIVLHVMHYTVLISDTVSHGSG